MTLAPLQREKIVAALLEFRTNYGGTQANFCKTMGINESSFSQLKKAVKDGNALDKIIKDDKLVIIGRRLNISFSSEAPWNIVRTETFEYITAQLEYCQENSTARIFCDIADIGKSTAAKHYMLSNQNVIYVDCSQYKTRPEFIRALGRAVGVRDTASVKDVYRDTIYMLHAMDKPLVILDEAGDLNYAAFLEIKGYWNALEGACGWYMMGADGLAKKITCNVECRKVGYAEILRRFGGEYKSVTSNYADVKGGEGAARIALFKKRQVMDIAEQNIPQGVDLKHVTDGVTSPTRVKENIRKAAKTVREAA
jgi:hypothetical protein